MGWPVWVFDIETIPDASGLGRLNSSSSELKDHDVLDEWLEARKERGQSDFLAHYFHRFLVISGDFLNAEGLKLHSFNDQDGLSEGKVIQSFFHAIDKHPPIGRSILRLGDKGAEIE